MLDRLLPDDEANRGLLQHVHPPGWIQPKPSGKYNLVVIGGGTAGLVSAAGAAGLGAKVALIERGMLGGDCLNVGCVPSKAILRSSKAMGELAHVRDLGIDVGDVRLSFDRAMRRMRELRASIAPNDGAERFRRLGVDVYFGSARFVSDRAIEVNGTSLEFTKAIIATGGRAVLPNIAGLADARPLTNETVFSLTELPGRLLVLGGGPIGSELAQAFARFGSEVTLIETGPHILSKEDEGPARLVQESLVQTGVRLHVKSSLARVTALATGGHRCWIAKQDGRGEEWVDVDAILVAVGRAPNVEGLGLESAGIRYSRDGIEVNDSLQTTQKHVYAVGDIASRYKFTHAADALARVAIRNALFFGGAKASKLLIPWCTYTDPEIAHVGLSEKEAAKRGVKIRVFEQSLAEVDRAILDGETDGTVRIFTSPKNDQILGATIVARHAGEMISEITLAMQAKVGLGRLASVIHPYPTQAEAIRKLGDQYQRTRLTPFVASLFRKWLAWSR